MRKMKPWPSDGSAVQFDEITDPICTAICAAYRLTRRHPERDIPWNGLDIGDREKGACFSPDEQLTADNLRYSLDEQGRDALAEIVGIAVRLGIEQGRRVLMQEPVAQLISMQADLLAESAREVRDGLRSLTRRSAGADER